MPVRSVLPVVGRGEMGTNPRRGVTLIELLVVLVLMAIGSALVVPAIRFPASGESAEPIAAGLMPSPDVDGIIATARNRALERGEPVRLRVAPDGVWAIVSARSGDAIASGRASDHPSWEPDMTIDATGTCVLSERVQPRPGARSWDALACRWRRASTTVAGVRAP
jgi:prepilin-type N-terminal cleavage/methylation domain-containing protein